MRDCKHKIESGLGGHIICRLVPLIPVELNSRYCDDCADREEVGGKSNNLSALSTQEGGNHYKDMVIQPIEYCQKNKLGALESFIVKYASRHGKKNGAEDVRKIIHCAELLLELEYGEEYGN